MTPGPGTWDPGSQEPGTKAQDHKTWGPGTLNFFIELQNKTLKSKKALTSKRDNAKHPFTYINFHIFFSKILGTVDFF